MLRDPAVFSCQALPQIKAHHQWNKNINPPHTQDLHSTVPGVPASSLGSSQIKQPALQEWLPLHSFTSSNWVSIMHQALSVGIRATAVTKARTTAPAP